MDYSADRCECVKFWPDKTAGEDLDVEIGTTSGGFVQSIDVQPHLKIESNLPLERTETGSTRRSSTPSLGTSLHVLKKRKSPVNCSY